MEITAENFLEQLASKGLHFDPKDRHIEWRDSINMENILSLDVGLYFTYKEMKINKDFLYLFSCSLDKKIKANCSYQAVLFLNPDEYNSSIRMIYWKIEKEINDSLAEIKKGWLFNSEDWYDSKIKTILVEYKEALDDIESIKNDYLGAVASNPHFEFKCSVSKLENFYDSVKRVDFILGIESFLRIANYGKNIEKYNLWLVELKE